MPKVIVEGLPSVFDRDVHLDALGFALKAAVAAIPELGVKSDNVTVYGRANLFASLSLPFPLSVTIQDLFDRPERTADVHKRLAKAVQQCVLRFVREQDLRCSSIEVSTHMLREPEAYACGTVGGKDQPVVR
jgi:hypothetical protein